MSNPCGLDPRQSDLVEPPDEFEEIPAGVLLTTVGPVSALAARETAPEDAKETQPEWPFEDDEGIGSRQSRVECGSGETAVADPSMARVSLGHTSSKIVPVRLLPARTPKENIKVYDQQTKPLAELAG
jgi:hypothetical protein